MELGAAAAGHEAVSVDAQGAEEAMNVRHLQQAVIQTALSDHGHLRVAQLRHPTDEARLRVDHSVTQGDVATESEYALESVTSTAAVLEE